MMCSRIPALASPLCDGGGGYRRLSASTPAWCGTRVASTPPRCRYTNRPCRCQLHGCGCLQPAPKPRHSPQRVAGNEGRGPCPRTFSPAPYRLHPRHDSPASSHRSMQPRRSGPAAVPRSCAAVLPEDFSTTPAGLGPSAQGELRRPCGARRQAGGDPHVQTPAPQRLRMARSHRAGTKYRSNAAEPPAGRLGPSPRTARAPRPPRRTGTTLYTLPAKRGHGGRGAKARCAMPSAKIPNGGLHLDA